MHLGSVVGVLQVWIEVSCFWVGCSNLCHSLRDHLVLTCPVQQQVIWGIEVVTDLRERGSFTGHRVPGIQRKSDENGSAQFDSVNYCILGCMAALLGSSYSLVWSFPVSSFAHVALVSKTATWNLHDNISYIRVSRVYGASHAFCSSLVPRPLPPPRLQYGGGNGLGMRLGHISALDKLQPLLTISLLPKNSYSN